MNNIVDSYARKSPIDRLNVEVQHEGMRGLEQHE